MVFKSGFPIQFWEDAVKFGAYVFNRSPSRSNPGRKSPLELQDDKAPSLLNIFVFGSTCMVYRGTNDRFYVRHVPPYFWLVEASIWLSR
jgi:hypothetical protein